MAQRVNLIHNMFLQLVKNPDLHLIDIFLHKSKNEELFREAKVKTGIDWHNTLYDELDGFRFEWVPKDWKNSEIKGGIKITQMENMMEAKGVCYNNKHYEKDFFILDNFNQKACVGFYKGDHNLFFNHYERGMHPLHLDLNGYIEVCIAAHGFLGWQNIIRGFITNEFVPEEDLYRKHMPGIITGASIGKIYEKYNSVKII